MEIREDPWLLLVEPTSPSQLDALLEYVDYREFLRKHGAEYDERYVWD